jgi:hypothetical protein
MVLFSQNYRKVLALKRLRQNNEAIDTHTTRREAWDLSRETEDPSHDTGDPSRDTADPSYETDDLSLNTDDLSRETEDPSRETDDLSCETDDLYRDTGNSYNQGHLYRFSADARKRIHNLPCINDLCNGVQTGAAGP